MTAIAGRAALTVESLMEALPALASEAEKRGREIEQLRKLPPDFAERLLRAGVFRLLVPRELGGLGGTFLDWWKVALAFSTADGSTGWVAGQGAMYCALISAKHPASRAKEIFENPLGNVTSSGVGSATAVRVEGGYRVTGRWRFESGCTLVTHFGGLTQIDGEPDPIGFMMLAPADQGTVHETWDVVGLAGTGSHEVEFCEVFVPLDLVHAPFDQKAEIDGPIAALAISHWWDACATAAVECGIARHTLDEVWKSARTKPLLPIGPSNVRTTDSAVLRTLQYGEGIYLAQVAAMERGLERAWSEACAGEFALESRIALQTSAVTAVHESKRVVDMVFEVAGTDGLMNSHVLSRLIRDAQAMPLHAVGRKGRFEFLARVQEGDIALAAFV